ncbi:tRNA pseudouridine(38-40) synthase, partial [hydrothermal vent metagenome]
EYLVGEHDFTSYRAQACQARSPVRHIYSLDVSRSREFIYLDICANAFLHHMVRNIAGVLMSIGAGEKPTDWAKTVLEHQDRKKGGMTAAAAGLYLVRVEYDAEFDLPAAALLPCYG